MIRWFRLYIFSVATAVFALDRISKYIALKSLTAGESVRLIPNILNLSLVLNNGAAFGLFKNGAVFVIMFSITAIALIMLFIMRSQGLSVPMATSLALVLGGAAGNLVDRFRFGHVIDFIDFRIWPVFNVADTAITIGVALLAVLLLTQRS